MVNYTGTTRYPTQTRQEVGVTGPSYNVQDWKPIEYAPTPEYKRQDLIAGITAATPITRNTVSGPSLQERLAAIKMGQAMLAEQQPKYTYVRGPYGLEVAPTTMNFEQHGRSMGLLPTTVEGIEQARLKSTLSPMEEERLKQEQMAREQATAWGGGSPGGFIIPKSISNK